MRGVACLRKEVGYGLWFQGGRRRLPACRQAGRPRHPQQTPFYQLACLRQAKRGRQVERFFPQFEAAYEERYQQDKTEHNAVGRFPEPEDDELLAGPSRNFQVFEPLDFLAEVTQHVPDPGEHRVFIMHWLLCR